MSIGIILLIFFAVILLVSFPEISIYIIGIALIIVCIKLMAEGIELYQQEKTQQKLDEELEIEIDKFYKE